jgi:hypothetical protein
MTGVREAKGDVIAWTHSDLQTDPEDIFRALELYRRDPDHPVVKGRRIKRPLKDWAFSAGMALIASVVLRKVFYEINAQPKLFSRQFLEYLKDAPHDFSLDLYLLYQAKLHKVPIKSIPVRFLNRLHGESSWATSFASKRKTINRTIAYIFALRRRTN